MRHITRLYRENNETLFAYAAFIGESTEYVLNQLVDTVLAKDRDFRRGSATIRAHMCRDQVVAHRAFAWVRDSRA